MRALLLPRSTSLRVRMVLATVGSVALLVVACGVLVVVLVRNQLVAASDDAALARATQLADLAHAGTLPHRLAKADVLEEAVQVIAGDRVLSSTDNATSPTFFAGVPRQSPGDRQVQQRATVEGEDEGPYRITALGTDSAEGNATVYVAVDTGHIDEFLTDLVTIGGAGLFAITVLAGMLFWVVIGRMLAPVGEIQRRADAITDQHQLKLRIPEPVWRDELGRLTRTINAMLARLEASARKQERFIADAAHELRSPLANSRTRLETALSAPGGAVDRDAVIRDALADNLRLSSLADKLLLLARTDSGELRIRPVPVDLDDLVREVVAGFGSTSVRLVARIEAPAQVSGDAALLEHALRNLVENALRHAHTLVEVTLTAAPPNAVLSVDDDGPGIPADARRRVFERFERLDGSRQRDTGGAGLGLSIVWQIVQAHHGTVAADDSPAGGARLRIVLPLSGPGSGQQDDDSVDQPATRSATGPTAQPAAGAMSQQGIRRARFSGRPRRG